MDSHLILGIIALVIGVMIGFMLGVTVGLRTAFKSVRQPPTPLPAILCALGAVITLLIAIGTGIYSTYFFFASQPATAVVLEVRETKDSEGHVSRVPVYSYKDALGLEHRDTSSLSDGREFAVGDVIPVRYLRNAPAESRIDYFSHNWFLPIFLALASIVEAAVGAALYWNYKRQTRTAHPERPKARA